MKFGDVIYGRDVEEVKSKLENHLPRIECPDKVKAGEDFFLRVYVPNHPNRVDHYIRWIEVYFYENGRSYNPLTLAKVEFSPEYVNPEVTLSLRIEKSGTIFALSYCTSHGIWENSKDVRVE